MQRFFSTLLLIFTVLVLPAQELPNIIPPSPEAASLGKFTEVPISHYTGVPNIGVPITTFSVGDKSFPVSINYHARGVQVSETASRVGLGWALNAGGQISRQIRNKPDDGHTGYWTMASAYANAFVNDNNDLQQAIGIVNSAALVDSQPDMLPDLFTLQTGELSTKFIFNYEDNQPLVQKYNDIIVEYVMRNASDNINGIAGFIITDKMGYKYYYGIDSSENPNNPVADVELMNKKFTFCTDGTFSEANPWDGVNTATEWTATAYANTWHITAIVSPNGDRVDFIYKKERNFIYRRSGDKYVGLSDNGGCGPYNAYANLIMTDQYQLEEIKYNYGTNDDYTKIVFEGGDSRHDMDNIWTHQATELDAIKIYKSQSYNDGSELIREDKLNKTFNLHHHYMTASNNADYPQILGVQDHGSNKRLILDSITEVRNGNSKPPYRFTYTSGVLPNRHSSSQDYWGYYNGANNGRFMTTNINQRVDTIQSEVGMLKKITYPTGGSTQFTYEHNKGHKGSEYDDIYLPDINPSFINAFGINSSFGLTYVSGGLRGGRIYKSQDLLTITSETIFDITTFAISDWGTEEVVDDLGNLITRPVNQSQACANFLPGNAPTSGCAFSVLVVRLDSNGLPISGEDKFIWSDTPNITLQPGQYQLQVHTPHYWEHNLDNTFLINLVGQDSENQDDILYAAGKRIKQIEFLDENNNVISKKTYDYKNSGIILGIANFDYNVDLGGIEFSSTPYHLFNHYQSNTIGYKFVDEYFGDKDYNHGKRSYEFMVTKDSGNFISRPRTPPTNNEWLRGLPLKVTDFKINNDGTYNKVKQIDNLYLTANDIHTNVLPPLENYISPINNNPILTPETLIFDLNHDGLILSAINELPQNPTDYFYQKNRTNYIIPFVWTVVGQGIEDFFPEGPQNYRAKIFHFTGGTIDTKEITETLYNENEQPTLVTTTINDYNYNKHYQPAAVTTVTSAGKPIMHTMTYPQDLVSAYTVHPENYSTDPIQALAEQHRFAPIETKTYKDLNNDGYIGYPHNEDILSSTATEYNWFSTNAGDILEPKSILTSKSNDVLEERIEFKKYDKNGNILEVTKTGGNPIIYIWGYNNTQPIAKLDNASYNNLNAAQQAAITAVKTASNNDIDRTIDTILANGTINYQGSEGQLRQALANLRTVFPESMITTYTYDLLIGVTSMTDSRGQTVYYEYDDFNRLKHIKDQDGNILSQNEYNYRQN